MATLFFEVDKQFTVNKFELRHSPGALVAHEEDCGSYLPSYYKQQNIGQTKDCLGYVSGLLRTRSTSTH